MMRAGSREVPEVGDDAAVIERSRREPEQFAVLFDRHAPIIHRYLSRRVGQQAADDLVAETFLAAFAKRLRYDPNYSDARGPALRRHQPRQPHGQQRLRDRARRVAGPAARARRRPGAPGVRAL